MIEEIKDTDGLRDPNTLKDILNMLIKEINRLELELNNKFDSKIKEEVEKSLEELDKKDESIEVQDEKMEEINIEKININKFVEAFSEYIKIESFSEEMENKEMIDKLIEIFKKIFGDKDKKIEEKEEELEIKNKEYGEEKDRLENNLKELEEKIKRKEEELEIKNKEYSEEKEKLENSLKELDEKIKGKERELEIKNKEYSEEKEKLENSLKELDEKIKGKERELEIKNKEYSEEKEKLENSLKELDEKIKGKERELEIRNKEYSEEKDRLENSLKKLDETIKKKEVKTGQLIEEYTKIKKERDSMGDLLIARRLYNEYLEMNTEVKSKFKNILLQKDFESFLSSGYSTSTMDNIWDIVKVEYKNISSENLEKLRKIFKFFITQMNKKFKDPNFALIEATLEEEFDPVTQFDLSQNSRGKIAEFIFYGYGTLEDKANREDEDIIDKIKKRPLVLTK